MQAVGFGVERLIRLLWFDQMKESGHGCRVASSLENMDCIMRDSFWMGLYPGITDEMIEYIAEMICSAIGV